MISYYNLSLSKIKYGSFQLNLATDIKYKNDDHFIFVILNPEKLSILHLPLGFFTSNHFFFFLPEKNSAHC